MQCMMLSAETCATPTYIWLPRVPHSIMFLTQLLLSGYSQTEDIIVATMVNNRKRPELADVIGPFANNVALRTNLSGVPPSPFSQSFAQSHDRSARLSPSHPLTLSVMSYLAIYWMRLLQRIQCVWCVRSVCVACTRHRC